MLVLAVQEEVNRFRGALRAEVLRQSALPRYPDPNLGGTSKS